MAHPPRRRILTINTGVYSLGASETLMLAARAERIGHSKGQLQITDTQGVPLLDQHAPLPDHDAALHALFAWFQGHRSGTAFDAVGHRVVHGGDRYQEPQHITDDLVATLQQLVPLSPDHRG
jgi:acetate kinase